MIQIAYFIFAGVIFCVVSIKDDFVSEFTQMSYFPYKTIPNYFILRAFPFEKMFRMGK